jgi:hypothetical protein
MKGRFEASWRIVLALAVVLSLGLMTAVPVMALSLTSVVAVPSTVAQAANYTISFNNAVAVNTSQSIYVYFPDANATTLAGVNGAWLDLGAITATVALDKYSVSDLYNNTVIITPTANITAGPHLLTFGNVTNLCPAGSHTLKVWTDAETTEVSTTYTLVASTTVSKIVISPVGATKTDCENVTFTAKGYDVCGDLIGTVAANWTDNATGGLSWVGNGTTAANVTACNATGTFNITGNYGGITDSTTLTITTGAAMYLTWNSTAPSSPVNCCDNITAVLNVTDCCGYGVSGVAVTASKLTGPGSLTGTTSATTNSSGQAVFSNLVLCTNGTYNLTFTAGSLSINATGIVVPAGTADHLVLATCPNSVVVNTTATYTAKVFDKCGNDLGAVTGGLDLTIGGSGANQTWVVNGTAGSANITPLKCGTYTVTANTTLNSTNYCTLTVTHDPCPVSITISPVSASVESGNAQQFTATATDAYGCTWIATADTGTTWSINLSAAGGKWDSVNPGKYISEHTGCFNVTVTECGVSDTAYLTVTPSMCFIATATYGTPMAQEIQILRAFRDGYLLTNPLGRALVAFYYRTSPPIAQFITEHPSLKPIVRAMLVPALAMSTIVVNNGVTLPLVVLGLVLVAVALAIWATRRRGRGSAYA